METTSSKKVEFSCDDKTSRSQYINVYNQEERKRKKVEDALKNEILKVEELKNQNLMFNDKKNSEYAKTVRSPNEKYVGSRSEQDAIKLNDQNLELKKKNEELRKLNNETFNQLSHANIKIREYEEMLKRRNDENDDNREKDSFISIENKMEAQTFKQEIEKLTRDNKNLEKNAIELQKVNKSMVREVEAYKRSLKIIKSDNKNLKGTIEEL